MPAEYEVVLGQRPVLAVVCLPDALPAAIGAGDVIGRAPDHLERVNDNANQGLKAREGGRKTAQKSRECKYVANKSHNTLLRCLRQ